MPASRFPAVSPLDRPFDTTFGLLRVRPAANTMPLLQTLNIRPCLSHDLGYNPLTPSCVMWLLVARTCCARPLWLQHRGNGSSFSRGVTRSHASHLRRLKRLCP
jgi:hypothetical protein